MENYAFISYVRESREAVSLLCAKLIYNHIKVWMDTDRLQAGGNWKREICKAIEGADFFLACFTREYGKRDSSHMNEEITQAIDHLRKLHPDKVWFIPVLLSGEMPNRRIGGGMTLRDIQYVDLRKGSEEEMDKLVKWLKGEA